MPDLPTGTVTFLFSDIEGSTKLLHELGDATRTRSPSTASSCASAFAAHDGVEIGTEGDAFFGAFAARHGCGGGSAGDPGALAPGPISVRIGVHTGEPQITDEGYVGLDVHRGARICAAGTGARCSSRSRPASSSTSMLATSASTGSRISSSRSGSSSSAPDFPPLKTLDWTNLPVQPTPLVGREQELADAIALLARTQRLLTLVGPGGTGKTRLALQLAAEVADEFQRVWWVALDQIRDPVLVERDDRPGDRRQRRSGRLPPEPTAAPVLDNLEQVLDCAPRLAELVAAARNLKLVATSREPLRLTGEQQYPVPPLPRGRRRRCSSTSARGPSGPTSPPTAPSPRSAAASTACRSRSSWRRRASRCCRPAALLARLEQRLPLLAGGARDAPERQRTLRAAIAWSYDLLEEHEQRLFARLAVFAGGWTLEAAEAVCEGDLDTLASLVDKSLVRAREGRFSMLETIREFARERLTEQEPDGASFRASRRVLSRTGPRPRRGVHGRPEPRAVRMVRA